MKSDYILFWLFNKIIEALDSQEQMHILCEQHYVKLRPLEIMEQMLTLLYQLSGALLNSLKHKYLLKMLTGLSLRVI